MSNTKIISLHVRNAGGTMKRSKFKRLTCEDKFDRAFACWTFNHGGWAKAKKASRQEARTKLKEELKQEVKEQ